MTVTVMRGLHTAQKRDQSRSYLGAAKDIANASPYISKTCRFLYHSKITLFPHLFILE